VWSVTRVVAVVCLMHVACHVCGCSSVPVACGLPRVWFQWCVSRMWVVTCLVAVVCRWHGGCHVCGCSGVSVASELSCVWLEWCVSHVGCHVCGWSGVSVACELPLVQLQWRVSLARGFSLVWGLPRVLCRVNTSLGSKEERMLMTGLHSVADIFCTGCGGCLGWKYIEAFESSQKYKEGKFIVEKARVVEGPPL